VDRTVLVVVRTLTTFAWILELLPELLSDRRVQILFTLDDDGSAYRDGAVEALGKLGARVVPWKQALATPFSLAIAASPNGQLQRLQAPLVLLPHGPGYSKRHSLPTSGLPPVPAVVTHEGWRTAVVLSHEEQRHQWGSDLGSGVRTVVVGDPCADRLRASMPKREEYRRSLRVGPGKRLVVTSSTWGSGASLALHPELPARLLAELPSDEYVSAAILHPNIWIGHGAWQVRLWLRRALEGGLRLIPPEAGWQSALVAADLLIGDHGSVSLYGMALGLPLLFSAFESDEIVETAPLAVLAQRAPHLAHERPLRDQVESAGFDRRPERYCDVADRVFAQRGHALENLRTLIYGAIGLEPPGGRPRVLPVAAPEVALRVTTAYDVRGWIETRNPRLRIPLERTPAALDLRTPDGEAHLGVDIEEQDQQLLDSAAVIFTHQTSQTPLKRRRQEADTWLAKTLDAYVGTRVVACALGDSRCAMRVRDGPLLEAVSEGSGADPGVLASALYIGWIFDGLDGKTNTRLDVVLGSQSMAVRIDVILLPD
jgi:hypothetical protein